MSDRVDDINSEINKKFKHHCWECWYHTNNIADLNRHKITKKHIKNINDNTDKSSTFKYHCWDCGFHANYESKFKDHNNTIKHKQNSYKNPNISSIGNVILIFIRNCENCESEFTYEGDTCWQCRLNSIDKMIKYEKCKNIKGFCNENDCFYCYNRSFLSNPKYIYLDIEYGIDPRQIAKQSNNLFNFLCSCNHKFSNKLSNIHNDDWCPYCCNPPKKLCEEKCEQCYNKSFASHERSKCWSDKNKISPRFVFKNTRERYIFDCDKCPHEFYQMPSHIVSNNSWCKYCSHRGLCKDKNCKFCFNNSFASHPLVEYFSDKNKEDPRYIFLNSSMKYIFNCNVCDNEFEIRLDNLNNGKWCSFCKKKTERKFMKWFKIEFDELELKSQVSFKWCKSIKELPFDFETVPLDLLIELDGVQHFKQVSNWKSPKLTQERDVYKMKQAIKNNKSIIRISQEDIWYDRYDWKSDITQYIKKYDKPTVIYLSKNKDLYNDHKLLMDIDKLKFHNNIIQIITKYI